MNTPRRHRPVGRGGRLLLRPAAASTARRMPLRVRSMVGLIPLFAVRGPRGRRRSQRLPGFKKRMELVPRATARTWRSTSPTWSAARRPGGHGHRLLAIPSRERLERVLRYLLDENEFLSPYGIRSLSRVHQRAARTCCTVGRPGVPRRLRAGRVEHRPVRRQLELARARSGSRSTTCSIEALERYHHFYGDTLQVECPTGSGQHDEPQRGRRTSSRARLAAPLPARRRRPPPLPRRRRRATPTTRTGATWSSSTNTSTATPAAGVGASHQTGWTALVSLILDDLGRQKP